MYKELMQVHIIIGPQGTSMCRRSPRVSRIPYKSGHFSLGEFVADESGVNVIKTFLSVIY